MDPLLFGLNDPLATFWASDAVPEFHGGKFRLTLPLGAKEMNVTTINKEEKIVTEVCLLSFLTKIYRFYFDFK